MKEIQFDQEARTKLLSGVEKLYKAVSSTLGAKGKHVIFNQADQIVVTKDGVTVANQFKLGDPIEDAGAKLVREAASRTARDAGDGTTTATVLSYHLIKRAMKYISTGTSAIDIKRGMEKASKDVKEEVDKMSMPISGRKDLFNIAKISGNNDERIGDMIADVFEKVGKSGAVRLEETQMNETVVDVVHGCQIDRGMAHQNFITNQSSRTADYSNPVIFVSDKIFDSSIAELKPVIEAAVAASRPLVIFCNRMEGEPLGTLMINKVRNGFPVLVVQTPEYEYSAMQQAMKDIAIITGATFVSEDAGIKTADFTQEMFGTADRVISDLNNTTIIGRYGDPDKIAERVKEIETELQEDKTLNFTWRLKKRIATLTGGVGVIYVGGNSPSETKEMYYRLEDALAATRAALEEGIVPGGGIAYLKAAQKIKERIIVLSGDEHIGYNMLLDAMLEPAKMIIHNSDQNSEVILTNILGSNEVDFGYDAMKNKFCNLYQVGIIDPTKVVKTAITNATSVAGMLITTDCVIVDKPKN